jgi:hypothetical protein
MIPGMAARVSEKMSNQNVRSLSFPILLALLVFNLTSTSSKSVLTPTHVASTACTTLKYYPAQVLDSYDTYSDIRINQIDSKWGLIIGVGQAHGFGSLAYPAVFSTYSSTISSITSESHKLSVMTDYPGLSLEQVSVGSKNSMTTIFMAYAQTTSPSSEADSVMMFTLSTSLALTHHFALPGYHSRQSKLDQFLLLQDETHISSGYFKAFVITKDP